MNRDEGRGWRSFTLGVIVVLAVMLLIEWGDHNYRYGLRDAAKVSTIRQSQGESGGHDQQQSQWDDWFNWGYEKDSTRYIHINCECGESFVADTLWLTTDTKREYPTCPKCKRRYDVRIMVSVDKGRGRR